MIGHTFSHTFKDMDMDIDLDFVLVDAQIRKDFAYRQCKSSRPRTWMSHHFNEDLTIGKAFVGQDSHHVRRTKYDTCTQEVSRRGISAISMTAVYIHVYTCT